MPDTPDNQPNLRQASLDAAIRNLYEVFSRYKLPSHVEGRTHCTSSVDDDMLHSKPLAVLSAADLQRFARKAMTTLGSPEDFKHFLPRLLEVVAREGEVGDTEMEIVLDKLNYAEWSVWPQEERTAIERYLMAAWRNLLTIYPASPSVDTWLCGIGQVLDDVSPFLDAWQKDESPTAAQHLVEFITYNWESITWAHRLWKAFWNDRNRAMRQIVGWLLKPSAGAYLEEAFFRYSAEPFANELSRAVQCLEWLRQQPPDAPP